MSTYSRESCALFENAESGTSLSPLPFNRLKTFEIQHVITRYGRYYGTCQQEIGTIILK